MVSSEARAELTSAAYLVVFLPTKKPPTSIFPGDNGITPADVTHEVNTLTDVYAISLIKERAERHLGQMARVLVSCRRAIKLTPGQASAQSTQAAEGEDLPPAKAEAASTQPQVALAGWSTVGYVRRRQRWEQLGV